MNVAPGNDSPGTKLKYKSRGDLQIARPRCVHRDSESDPTMIRSEYLGYHLNGRLRLFQLIAFLPCLIQLLQLGTFLPVAGLASRGLQLRTFG